MTLYVTLSFTHDNQTNYVNQAINDFIEEHGFTLKALNLGNVEPMAAEVAAGPVKQAAAPKAIVLPFKRGQHLFAYGDRLRGEVEVVAVWGKAGDGGKYDRPRLPYPQVEVQPLRGGNPWHFDGNDIAKGKLVAIAGQ